MEHNELGSHENSQYLENQFPPPHPNHLDSGLEVRGFKWCFFLPKYTIWSPSTESAPYRIHYGPRGSKWLGNN